VAVLATDWRRAADLDEADRAMLEYAEKLTLAPPEVTETDVQRLRDVGFSDEQILDVVIVTAYRAFINRVRSGLGVELSPITTERADQRIIDAVEQASGRQLRPRPPASQGRPRLE
jgi:uncharacterized protein YciW